MPGPPYLGITGADHRSISGWGVHGRSTLGLPISMNA
jgi:hypothetical protein